MDLFEKNTSYDWWRVITDNGDLRGNADFNGDTASFSDGRCTLSSVVTSDESGVYSRCDTIKNVSGDTAYISCANMRFVLDGGEYDVYTQYNAWQNESCGMWQPLNTEVEARTESFRTSWASAPFVALWNKQTERGLAFHLLPDCSWRISVRRVPLPGENSQIVVELGPEYCGLNLQLGSGEELALPEVLYYEIHNRTDLDCWRLHRYCHRRWPRLSMPVIYNSWMYRFDQVNYDVIHSQIGKAAELGAEYFVIDAGWFGHNTSWSTAVGDWQENENAAFCGRLIEIAEEVRRHNMKFGLWFEPERASVAANAPKEHPEFYLRDNDEWCFLDFANPEACDYMLEILTEQLKKYDIKFVKFDFNADLVFDKRRTAFMDYFRGYRAFLRRLKERFPDLYIENCASGGERTNLTNLADFGSFWPSDCQSPYVGLRIIKDSIKRLPPQVLERWVVIQSLAEFKPAYGASSADKLIACADGIWDHLSGVHRSFMEGFMTGGPIGFSCDLNALSDDAFDWLKQYVANFKAERQFWQTAECRILAETDSVLVLQYSDPAYRRVRLQVITERVAQSRIRVYPKLPETGVYSLENGNAVTAVELMQNGLTVEQARDYRAANYRMQEIVLNITE